MLSETEIKNRVIKDFVKENKRAPYFEELKALVKSRKDSLLKFNEIGYSGNELDFISFRENSSAEKENKNRETIFLDHVFISKKLDNLNSLLNDSFLSINKNIFLKEKELRALEEKTNALLLLSNKTDKFLFFAKENFDFHDFVVIEETDALLESGYVSLNKDSFKNINISNASVNARIVSEKPIKQSYSLFSVENLKKQDNSSWNHMVYTDYKNGRISCVLEFDLKSEVDITEIVMESHSMNSNNICTVTVSYSTNGNDFEAIEPYEKAFVKNKLSFNLNKSAKKVRIIFSKDSYDFESDSNQQYIYSFGLDSIYFYKSAFSLEEETLVCGPYLVKDTNNKPVTFSKLAFDACTIEPEGTSVSFYVSKDKENWSFVDHKKEFSNVVSFENVAGSEITEAIDPEFNKDRLCLINEQSLSLSQDESILNFYVKPEYSKKVINNNISIKRNIKKNIFSEKAYGSDTCWYYDQDKNKYYTSIEIISKNGLTYNLGNSSVKINGLLKTGEFTLPSGAFFLEVDASNYLEIPDNLNSINDLKREDTLYPYNHKYLFTGYNYPSNFKGDKIYSKPNRHFGYKMEYLPEEEFNMLTNSFENFRFYTIVESEKKKFVKLKTNKSYTDFVNEVFEVDLNSSVSGANTLYVKALLKTSSPDKTPIIEDFIARVI